MRGERRHALGLSVGLLRSDPSVLDRELSGVASGPNALQRWNPERESIANEASEEVSPSATS
jgi:hypothetical protein